MYSELANKKEFFQFSRGNRQITVYHHPFHLYINLMFLVLWVGESYLGGHHA